jgi:hypothetical protein
MKGKKIRGKKVEGRKASKKCDDFLVVWYERK